ncbi:MAG TPA: DUF3300 domain-containing protein [Desulfomonilia bacterium]
MKTKGSWKLRLTGFIIICLAFASPVSAQDTPTKKFKQEELDQMLAPIALYPDSLLAQIFMASTYPIEVVQADRWLQNNKSLKGDKLKAALDKQTWDESVKSLVSFPDVLDMMNDKLDWTQNLGDAFLAQQKDVMDTVQKLRKKAYQAGNLKSNQQQQVTNDGSTVIIQSANPQVIYVPVYDPTVIYGTWWYPAYPPYPVYTYPPGAALVTFTVGVAVGAAWYGWSHGCNWHGGTIIVTPPPPPPPPPHHGPGPTPPPPPHGNGNNHPDGNHPPDAAKNINGGGKAPSQWQHNPDHRQGVAYGDTATRKKYSPSDPAGVNSRMDYRGYGNSGSGAGNSVFSGMDRGNEAQRDSDRGNQSLNSSRFGGGDFSRSSGEHLGGGGGRNRL